MITSLGRKRTQCEGVGDPNRVALGRRRTSWDGAQERREGLGCRLDGYCPGSVLVVVDLSRCRVGRGQRVGL